MPRVRVKAPFLDDEYNRVRMIGHAFDCPEARAEQLAELGLVEPADGAQVWPPAKLAGNLVGELLGEPEQPAAQDAPKAASADGPTRAQLVERCEELGIEYPARANKAKLAQLIEQAEAGE